MQYRLYGLDGATREPREPLDVVADSEDEARHRAKDLGMAVLQVEAVEALAPSPAWPASAAAAFPYSPWTNTVLSVGTVVAELGCVGAVLWAVVAAFEGDWLTCLVGAPLAAALQLALVIVFERAKDLQPPDRTR
jgi:hypothetical protein